MNGCSFQKLLRHNLSWFLPQQKNVFSKRFYFKANRKSKGSSKKTILWIFGIFGIFYVTIAGNFECFQYFNFETNFLKNENLFLKKLENRFVVESTTTESLTQPYKIAFSKWTCHKEHSFASIYFFFFSKILFQYKNLL